MPDERQTPDGSRMPYGGRRMREDSMAEEKTIFICGPEPDDIFTAVYDAWASRLGHENVELEIEGEREPRLFARYMPVERDREKAEKVARSVKKKLSMEAYHGIYRASLSFRPERAEVVYRFLVLAFAVGPDAVYRLQEPAAARLFELSRKVANESHYFLEFTRFAQWENGTLFAKIRPKCNVLSMVAPHFDNRLSGESWIIYDEGRRKAAVHPAGGSWFLVDTRECGLCDVPSGQTDGSSWAELWRTFVRNIAITPRENRGLQRGMLPLWYRKNMTEFQAAAGAAGEMDIKI